MRLGDRKSACWKYFTKSDDAKYVKCKVCHKEFKFFGNTTNLNSHIKRMHSGETKSNFRMRSFVQSGNEETKPQLLITGKYNTFITKQ